MALRPDHLCRLLPSAIGTRRRAPARAVLLSGVACLLPLAAGAQDGSATPQDTTVLQSITVERGDDESTIVAGTAVSGSKTDADIMDIPASVSVVTAKEVETRKADNLQEVLAYTAGVAVDDYGSDDRYDFYRIRGFYETEQGTYRDGLPVRGAGWTYMRLQPYGFERFEVLKGSNSSLFGLNAPGGLVNAVTKQPTGLRFGSAYTTLGDGHTELGTDFGGPLDPHGQWSYRVTAKWQDADTGADYSMDDQAYLGLALRYQPSEATTLTLLADYSRRKTSLAYGIPIGVNIAPTTFLGEPDYNHNTTTEKSLGYLFEHDFGNGLTLRQNARYTWFDLDNEMVYPNSADPTADREAFAVDGSNKQFAVDTQLQFDASLGSVKSRTLAGIEYDWFNEHEQSYYGWTIPGLGDYANPVYCGRACVTVYPYLDWTPKQLSTAAYLQEELTFNERWILTLGGRFDHVKTTGFDSSYAMATRTDNNFSKRIGLTYKVTPGLSAYANYSESFQPNFWNVDAGPKEGTQYEVGLKYRPEAVNAQFSAAIFDLTQTNVATYISPTVTRQIGEVRVRGLELEGKMAMNERLNMTVAYSYWDAEITKDGAYGTGGSGSNAGNRPSLVPEQIASIWADYTLPGNDRRGDMTFGLGTRFVGTRYADDANTVRIGSFAVVDAMYDYQLRDNVNLTVNVSNLFDRTYIAASYGSTNYYGDGRKVTATLRYKW